MAEASPLHWPTGWPRTKNPRSSRFGSWNNRPSIAQGTNKVLDEIRLLGGKSPIISTDLKLRQDGLPYSAQRQPDDQGAAVYFTWNNEQMVIACDTFDKIGCNLWAIGKTVEAMRGIDRWGCSELLNRAFTGFKALPESGSETLSVSWMEVFSVGPDDDFETVKYAWKLLVKKYHPDNPDTGDEKKLRQIQEAYKQAKEAHGVQ